MKRMALAMAVGCAAAGCAPASSVRPDPPVIAVGGTDPCRGVVEFCGQQFESRTTRVTCRDPDIDDLSPLSCLQDLEALDLSTMDERVPWIGLEIAPYPEAIYGRGNNVYDLTPLSQLLRLERLRLPSSNVTDLTPLSGLSSLELLDVANTSVHDLGALRGLTNLRELDLSETGVRDLSPLQGGSELRALRLSNTRVRDLGPLATHRKLAKLGLDNTKPQSLAPLEGLGLQVLLARYVDFGDGQVLASLTRLEELHAEYAGLKDAGAAIAKLTELTSLDARRSDLDSTALAKLVRLQHLKWSPSDATQLELLSGHRQLRGLVVTLDEVSDLGWVVGLTDLRSLRFEHASVATTVDLSPLTKLTKLRELGLGVEFDGDLSPLVGVPSLKRLGSLVAAERLGALAKLDGLEEVGVILSPSTPRTLEQLRHFPKLRSLGIWFAGYADSFAPVGALTQLRILRLQHLGSEKGNPIDLQFVASLPRLEEFSTLGGHYAHADALARCPVLRELYWSAQPNGGLGVPPTLRVLSIGGGVEGELVAPKGTPLLREAELPAARGLPAAVASSPKLRQLSIWPRDDQPVDLAGVAAPGALRVLHIGSPGPADPRQLAAFRALRSLDVSNGEIADLQPLANLRYLRRVDLSKTGASSLRAAGGWPRLRTIRFRDTTVSSVAPLRGLQLLRMVDGEGSSVPAAELLELQPPSGPPWP